VKLFYSPPSPFARKCRIVVRERNLLGRVEEIAVMPTAGDDQLGKVNPLMQAPALLDDAGVAWNDSPLICQYLDTLGEGPRLISEGDARWAVLRREVIADGASEMGVKIRLESVRPEGERSKNWIERWRGGLIRSLDAAESAAPDKPYLDVASIATVCALTWFDLRFADLGWRDGRPKLAALQAELEKRPSFRETAPA
jgi:glutathione S-transferase